MKVSFILLLIASLLLHSGCQPRKLPVLGDPEMVKVSIDGKEVTTAVYPVIPAFSFKNQHGKTVTEKTLEGKVYVADFFFTSGPKVCWIMKQNMVRVYDAYKEHRDVNIVSHTIDPLNDSIDVLHRYSKKLGVAGEMWHFVTGDYEKIREIGKKHYLLNMQEDPSEPGVHICAFVLIDKQKHIRGFYDGSDKREVDQLVSDIALLIDE